MTDKVQEPQQVKGQKKKKPSLAGKLTANFFVSLIPGVGPFFASKTRLAYKALNGNTVSPEGLLIITMAFFCDLISFVPIIGPIIATSIIAFLLAFRSQFNR